jgi:hypothetical protein
MKISRQDGCRKSKAMDLKTPVHKQHEHQCYNPISQMLLRAIVCSDASASDSTSNHASRTAHGWRTAMEVESLCLPTSRPSGTTVYGRCRELTAKAALATRGHAASDPIPTITAQLASPQRPVTLLDLRSGILGRETRHPYHIHISTYPAARLRTPGFRPPPPQRSNAQNMST